jgi:hypothetical protein
MHIVHVIQENDGGSNAFIAAVRDGTQHAVLQAVLTETFSLS